MKRAFRKLAFVSTFGLSVLGLSGWLAGADAPAGSQFKSADRNHAAQLAKPAYTTPASAEHAAAHHAVSTNLVANTVQYYPGYCGCYYFMQAPAPTVVSARPATSTPPSQPTPNATAQNANPATSRFFSADPGASATYYYYPGTYGRSYSSGGHSWGSRH